MTEDDSFRDVLDSDYVTAASTPDATTAIVYVPTSREITVDTSRFAKEAEAYWIDPTSAIGGQLGSRLTSHPGLQLWWRHRLAAAGSVPLVGGITGEWFAPAEVRGSAPRRRGSPSVARLGRDGHCGPPSPVRAIPSQSAESCSARPASMIVTLSSRSASRSRSSRLDRAAQTVGVDVDERGAADERRVHARDDEGGRRDRSAHAQALGDALGQGRLASPEVAAEHDEVASAKQPAQARTEGLRVLAGGQRGLTSHCGSLAPP